MSNVALIIIYNHKFDKNIEVLEELYSGRFSTIFHLVPFYTGEKDNVIPVYGNSFYFQGYIAQAFKSFYKEEFEHYFFIADDMLINPLVDETNYKNYINLTPDASFIPNFVSLDKCTSFWARIPEAVQYNIKLAGVEATAELPSYKDALDKFKKNNLTLDPIPFHQVFEKIPFRFKKKYFSDYLKRWYYKIKHRNGDFSMPYPLVGAYSDICIVSKSSIRLFCHYCGVFSATNLFVELAIPTSIVLSSDNIVTERQSQLKGKALWSPEDYKIIDVFQYDLNNLLDQFPQDVLYLHPIKLSKWKIIKK